MKKRTFHIISLALIIALMACSTDPLPKPRGHLRLEYPAAVYQNLNLENCPYKTEYSIHAKVEGQKQNCWFDLNYPEMKANLHITYYPVANNLKKLIADTEKLTFEHTAKATYIKPQNFEFSDKKVFGTLFELGGPTAVQYQFYATDSTKHLIYGSVYFDVAPQPDSLSPAAEYLQKDVRHLIETLEWK